MGREIVSIATALVPYPPERVWAVVTDLDCWQWRSDLSRLDHVGEDAFTEYDRSGFPTRFTAPPGIRASALRSAACRIPLT